MRTVLAEQMRALDRRTIEEHGTSGRVLMDRAGRGVAGVIRDILICRGRHPARINVVAGHGSNGGDAFVAAGCLRAWGHEVDVLLAGSRSDVQGDALFHLDRLIAARVPFRELPKSGDWNTVAAEPAADVVVDGLLGTGTAGAPRGVVASAIACINAMASRSLVVAIDLPSGLNADSGAPMGETVQADVTVTLGLPKRGLAQPAALDVVGSVEVVDIGIPPAFVDALDRNADLELIQPADLAMLFARRPRAAHKGNYGQVLLIGGARGFAGAIALAAGAALRSGVGLVSVLTPRSIAPVVAGLVPEAMVREGGETETGSLSHHAARDQARGMDAVLVGPGMTTHPESAALVSALLAEVPAPLVLDADALNVLAGAPERLRGGKSPIVITPHPGELARLLKTTAADIQRDRCASAKAAAAHTGATVVLKGAGTLVAAEGRPMAINLNGNPGMATGGSGDVLAGLLTGLLGQGLKPLDAARAAVYLHGRAGDVAAWRGSQPGLVAGDILQALPAAWQRLTAR